MVKSCLSFLSSNELNDYFKNKMHEQVLNVNQRYLLQRIFTLSTTSISRPSSKSLSINRICPASAKVWRGFHFSWNRKTFESISTCSRNQQKNVRSSYHIRIFISNNMVLVSEVCRQYLRRFKSKSPICTKDTNLLKRKDVSKKRGSWSSLELTVDILSSAGVWLRYKISLSSGVKSCSTSERQKNMLVSEFLQFKRHQISVRETCRDSWNRC